MIRRLFIAALVLAGAATSFAQNAPDAAVNLTGKWLMQLEMSVGTSTPVVVFKQDAGKLTGTYTGRYGEFQLVGKVDGRKLDFVVTINAEGTETRMSFTGELTPAGDVLKGNAELGGMGEATWLAKREKK